MSTTYCLEAKGIICNFRNKSENLVAFERLKQDYFGE